MAPLYILSPRQCSNKFGITPDLFVPLPGINMSPMIHFFPHPVSRPLPVRFNNPFDYTPHPLCAEAASIVQNYLRGMDFWKKNPEEGKMFGVLIVKTPEGETGFLAAFSGILDGNYLHPWFVPPIYNLQQPDGFFREEEQNISLLNDKIRQLNTSSDYREILQALALTTQESVLSLSAAKTRLKADKLARDTRRQQGISPEEEKQLIRESQQGKADYKRLERQWKDRITGLQNKASHFSRQVEALKQERRQRSAALQQRLFEQFRLMNAKGETKNLCSIFQENGHSLPPAGAGECAAPKLLQYAYRHQLHPVAMAEFWWGTSPKTEIRRQGYFYPACSAKCGPILSFMLQGLNLEPSSGDETENRSFPEIVYEDQWLLVINKPAGMLSVPGKSPRLSVYDLIRSNYPAATGPLLVHRLDMDTSGLLVAAKNKTIHAHLQRQFLNHTFRKKYIALLEGPVSSNQGRIKLPLCPDPADRPRQMVSETYGKPAITFYRVIERTPRHTRIAFYPYTGRTHQLRVHAAHPLGLNHPIKGDRLYGQKSDRLYLHAEYLEFIHPVTGEKIRLEKKADF